MLLSVVVEVVVVLMVPHIQAAVGQVPEIIKPIQLPYLDLLLPMLQLVLVEIVDKELIPVLQFL